MICDELPGVALFFTTLAWLPLGNQAVSEPISTTR